VHANFRHWLDEGVIRVARHWWGARFAEFYNDGMVGSWIDSNREAYNAYVEELDPLLKDVEDD